ncbi:hypothetical protein B0H19DRAFT_1367154 [Mycena capillaripes]|nr:hypothetical protein B0H19DRAFT_1367154 [Mycena capillaripes]
MKVEKEHWKRLAREEGAWQARLAARPILTGTLLKASLYNPPLPRMKPQPPVISRIIMTRMRTRDRRFARQEQLNEDLDDLRREAVFEEHLVRLVGAHSFTQVYSGDAALE